MHMSTIQAQNCAYTSYKQPQRRSKLVVPAFVEQAAELIDMRTDAPCSHDSPRDGFFDLPGGMRANITGGRYLKRLYRGSRCTEAVLVAQLVLLFRYPSVTGIALDSRNVHRLLLTTLLVATKMVSDVVYLNSCYEKLGDLPLRDINEMELRFLQCLDWDVVVSPEQWKEMKAALVAQPMPSLIDDQPTTFRGPTMTATVLREDADACSQRTETSPSSCEALKRLLSSGSSSALSCTATVSDLSVGYRSS